MKKLIAIILLLTLSVSLLAGCGKQFLDTEDAQKIALKDLGIKEKDADGIHTHGGESANGPVYSVHIDYNGQTYEYIIRAVDGQILSKDTVEGH